MNCDTAIDLSFESWLVRPPDALEPRALGRDHGVIDGCALQQAALVLPLAEVLRLALVLPCHPLEQFGGEVGRDVLRLRVDVEELLRLFKALEAEYELDRHREFLIDPRLGPEQPYCPAAVLTVDEPGNRLIAEQEDGVRGRVAASIDSSLDTCLVSLVVKGDPYSRREVVDIDGQGLPLAPHPGGRWR